MEYQEQSESDVGIIVPTPSTESKFHPQKIKWKTSPRTDQCHLLKNTIERLQRVKLSDNSGEMASQLFRAIAKVHNIWGLREDESLYQHLFNLRRSRSLTKCSRSQEILVSSSFEPQPQMPIGHDNERVKEVLQRLKKQLCHDLGRNMLCQHHSQSLLGSSVEALLLDFYQSQGIFRDQSLYHVAAYKPFYGELFLKPEDSLYYGVREELERYKLI